MAPKKDNVAELQRLIESAPLYSLISLPNLDFGMPGVGKEFLTVPVTFRVDLECPACRRERTFQPWWDFWPREDAIKVPIKDAWKFRMGMPHFLVFQCSSCLAQRATVTLETGMRGSEGIVLKVGQSPQIRTPVNPRVAKAMGGALGLFRQGLTSEAHGFGIGAYAYYRQVAENLVDSLVKQLRTEAEALQFKELIDAIDRLAPTARPSEKIGIVKDHLPPSLRPEGANPLGSIYKALSEGIHAGTDEGCLKQARTLRGALTFVLQQLAESKEHRATFLADVRELNAAKEPPASAAPTATEAETASKTGT